MPAKKKINPTKQGALHKATGTKKGAVIPKSKLKSLAKSGDKATATKAKFALNKRKVTRKSK